MTLPNKFSLPVGDPSAVAQTSEEIPAEEGTLDADLVALKDKWTAIMQEIDNSNAEAMQYQIDDTALQQREADLNAEKATLDAAVAAHSANPSDPNDDAAVAAHNAEAAVTLAALAELNIRINQKNQDQAACDARHAEHISQAHLIAAKYDALVEEMADYDARATAFRTSTAGL